MFYVKKSVNSVAGRSFPSLEIEIPPRRKYIYIYMYILYVYTCMHNGHVYFIYNMQMSI